MTLLTYHERDRSRSRPSVFATLGRTALLPVLKLREEWHRRQTEKMLEGLDPEIRKDIGWPATDVMSNRK